MIFQDCAVTTRLKSKIFTSFYRQKFVFEYCYGIEVKKLISLLFWLSVSVFWVCFSAKRGGVYNIFVFLEIFIMESKYLRGAKIINLTLGFW